ncbi:MAG: tetratricopeptide repeat protein [Flavobacteriales bacterium]
MKTINYTILFVLMFLLSCNSSDQTEIDSNLQVETEEVVFEKIIELEKHMLHGDGKTNMNKSTELLILAKDFAGKYPESKSLENVLLIGSNAARGLGRIDDAIALLTQLIDKYASSENHVVYMYTRAFVMDEAGRKDMAKNAYTEVANKYPEHQFGLDSKARIETIDLTDEQLIEWLNQKVNNEQLSSEK